MTTTTQTPAAQTVLVGRRVEREPSNSKCPGSSRHVSIGAPGASVGEKFAARAEDRGTGYAVASLPMGPAIIRMGGEFRRASGKGDRRALEQPVLVTGVESDELLLVLDGGSQQIEIRFYGVIRAARFDAETGAAIL